MLDTWDAHSVGADEVAVDEEGNPLLDEFGEPISLTDPEKIEVFAIANYIMFVCLCNEIVRWEALLQSIKQSAF